MPASFVRVSLARELGPGLLDRAGDSPRTGNDYGPGLGHTLRRRVYERLEQHRGVILHNWDPDDLECGLHERGATGTRRRGGRVACRREHMVWCGERKKITNGCMTRMGRLCDTCMPPDAARDTDGDVVEFREARPVEGQNDLISFERLVYSPGTRGCPADSFMIRSRTMVVEQDEVQAAVLCCNCFGEFDHSLMT
jgi:hypothetical protein